MSKMKMKKSSDKRYYQGGRCFTRKELLAMLIVGYDFDEFGVRTASELMAEYIRQEQEWCEQYPTKVMGIPTGFEPAYFAEYVILEARDRILLYGEKFPKLEAQIIKEGERILHRSIPKNN